MRTQTGNSVGYRAGSMCPGRTYFSERYLEQFCISFLFYFFFKLNFMRTQTGNSVGYRAGSICPGRTYFSERYLEQFCISFLFLFVIFLLNLN